MHVVVSNRCTACAVVLHPTIQKPLPTRLPAPKTLTCTAAEVATWPLARHSAADAASGPAPDSMSQRGDSGSQAMPAKDGG